MTHRRTAEWDLVGHDRDPVPASSDDVEQVAKDFKDRGTVMSEAASTLESLADLEGWTGEAAKKFAEKAGEAHGDMAKAAQKYTDAGAALTTYAGAVDTARTATWNAVQAAEQAKRDQASTQGDLLEDVDEPTDEQRETQRQRSEDHAAAVSAMSQARKDLDNAMEALSTAASNAAARINSASEQFKDSTMDNIKGFVAAAIDVLNVIALVILAIVIIVLVVATFGGALAAVAGFVSLMMTISTIVGAAILVLTVAQVAMGEASWGDVAWASLAVLGPGVGKLGSMAARPVIARMASVARTSAAASARSSLSYRVAGQLQRIPFGPLREGLENFRAGLVDNAVDAVNHTISTIPRAGPWATALGADAATDVYNSVRVLGSLGDQAAADVARLTTIARTQMAAGGLGLVGNGHDIPGLPEAVANTFDNLQHLDDVFRFDAPDRPTTIVGAGR